MGELCGTYGLSAEQLDAQLTQHNPIDRLAPLAKAGVPIFHIHGDADKLVPLADNSAELARRYRELGGSMRLRIPPGQGHNVWDGFFQCQEGVLVESMRRGHEHSWPQLLTLKNSSSAPQFFQFLLSHD